jgi:hypothetical protein
MGEARRRKLTADVLALAKALGWPAGVTVDDPSDDSLITAVAGGEGGESAWREWVAAYDADWLTSVWSVLDYVQLLVEHGIDPGPPATWLDQERASLDAIYGEDYV